MQTEKNNYIAFQKLIILKSYYKKNGEDFKKKLKICDVKILYEYKQILKFVESISKVNKKINYLVIPTYYWKKVTNKQLEFLKKNYFKN